MSSEFLKREAAEKAYGVSIEKDRTLMRLEEMKFLTTSTKDLLQESGAEDEDYYNMALLDYEAETEVCSGKRYMTYRSSSFNTYFGEASINLNVDVCDDEKDEVEEIRRAIGGDKARHSMK
ncbi:hypothetical protein Tco_0986994 [Tanacetum coccineum]